MEAFNLSPFSFAYLPGRVDFPAHSLTVIVKGTFTMTVSEWAGKSTRPGR